MLSVINQFRRIYNDDGRNDKNFYLQEMQWKLSQDNLKVAAEALIKAAQDLHDVLLARKVTRIR